MNETNDMLQLYRLLALEYNCSPADFETDENLITEPALLPGRRVYSEEAPFFSMVTTGKNAVITADVCLHPFLEGYIKGKQGHWLFELHNLLPLEKELEKYAHSLCQSYHMFLPGKRVLPNGEFSVKWYGEKELKVFYGDSRFG